MASRTAPKTSNGSVTGRVTRSASGASAKKKPALASASTIEDTVTESESDDEEQLSRKRRRTTNGKQNTGSAPKTLEAISAKLDNMMGSAMTHRDYVELRDLIVSIKKKVEKAPGETQELTAMRRELASAQESTARAKKKAENLAHKLAVAEGLVSDKETVIERLEVAAQVNDCALQLYQQLTDLGVSVKYDDAGGNNHVVKCAFAPKWDESTKFKFSLEFATDENDEKFVIFEPSMTNARGAALSKKFSDFQEQCKLPPSGLSSFFLLMLEQCRLDAE
ncbi:hypothetical protein AURDEDRAFT_139183 [Auricularia subglabra TFB-10046 SS5]|nr:hypothetical protein AURDEDRAFT_139183 [Auricularia subglabra TFB-10046 SS5]